MFPSVSTRPAMCIRRRTPKAAQAYASEVLARLRTDGTGNAWKNSGALILCGRSRADRLVSLRSHGSFARRPAARIVAAKRRWPTSSGSPSRARRPRASRPERVRLRVMDYHRAMAGSGGLRGKDPERRRCGARLRRQLLEGWHRAGRGQLYPSAPP